MEQVRLRKMFISTPNLKKTRQVVDCQEEQGKNGWRTEYNRKVDKSKHLPKRRTSGTSTIAPALAGTEVE